MAEREGEKRMEFYERVSGARRHGGEVGRNGRKEKGRGEKGRRRPRRTGRERRRSSHGRNGRKEKGKEK